MSSRQGSLRAVAAAVIASLYEPCGKFCWTILYLLCEALKSAMIRWYTASSPGLPAECVHIVISPESPEEESLARPQPLSTRAADRPAAANIERDLRFTVQSLSRSATGRRLRALWQRQLPCGLRYNEVRPAAGQSPNWAGGGPTEARRTSGHGMRCGTSWSAWRSPRATSIAHRPIS